MKQLKKRLTEVEENASKQSKSLQGIKEVNLNELMAATQVMIQVSDVYSSLVKNLSEVDSIYESMDQVAKQYENDEKF